MPDTPRRQIPALQSATELGNSDLMLIRDTSVNVDKSITGELLASEIIDPHNVDPESHPDIRALIDAAKGPFTETTSISASPVLVNEWAIAEGEIWRIRFFLVALRDDTSEGFTADIGFSVMRPTGGDVALIGAYTGSLDDNSSGTPNISISVNTGTQRAQLYFIGEAGKEYTINGKFDFSKN